MLRLARRPVGLRLPRIPVSTPFSMSWSGLQKCSQTDMTTGHPDNGADTCVNLGYPARHANSG